ncbi:MAG: peptidoglycan DD-metalloendopeptidase family protein [Acidobacteriota bacterium]
MTLGLMLSAAAVATAQDSGERETALAGIRAEIAKLETRATDLRQRERTLANELDRVEVELSLQEAQLEEATTAAELAASQAADAEAKVARLTVALSETRAGLRRQLTMLYQLGRQGYLRLFLSLDGSRDVLPAIRQLRFLAFRDRRSIDRFTALRDDLSVEEERLEARLAEQEAWRLRELERRDRLAGLRTERAALLERLNAQRRRVEAETAELTEKEEKLARLITALTVDDEPLAGQPIQGFFGVLDRPVEGALIGEFGPRRDPRYGTKVPYNGIDIAAEPGAKVKAIYPGEVLFAAPFEGYGKMVVIHHPGRVFSLYARLADLTVTQGAMVSLGTEVGTSTDLFYFEIRRENQAEDPLPWLR